MPETAKPHWSDPDWVQTEILSSLSMILSVLQSIHQQQLVEYGSRDRAVTKSDLEHTERTIMSAISDFATKQKQFNDRQAAAIDGAVDSVQGIVSDIQTLNDKITELQNSTGGVTPEDQALINDLETQGDALATKAEAVQAALATLDAQTPPVVPPAP